MRIRAPRTDLLASLSACSTFSTQNCGIRWLTLPASSMNSVDSLVASYVDSTTFLNSPTGSGNGNQSMNQSNLGNGGEEC